ncbi:MAG: aminopeptidase [Lachnospiraceae bacterium]|nr:aminopeptidase [Lachnospiraceae bacterium]
MYLYRDEENAGLLAERRELAMERIRQIGQEELPAGFGDGLKEYFRSTAAFVCRMGQICQALESGEADGWDRSRWEEINREMYADILPDHYSESFANPDYAVRRLGPELGQLLSFLYVQLRGLTAWTFEGQLELMVIHMELLIEVFNQLEDGEEPEQIRRCLYWFLHDNCDIIVTERIRQSVDETRDFAGQIIRRADLSDPIYLYYYGEYVSSDELETARAMNALSQDEVEAIARVFTEGYRIGFVKAGKDLSRKRTVNIRYQLGFERLIAEAIRQFEQMGLKAVIFRSARSILNCTTGHEVGYVGGHPNRQMIMDHQEDLGLFLDKKLVSRRLEVIESAYQMYEEQARGHAGPAVLEVFGEEPFTPADCESRVHLSGKQQSWLSEMNTSASRLANRYIPGDERSFTIMALPLPSIGPDYPEIFKETVRINSLDAGLYERIQQTLIDALDQGEKVRILGMNGNHTDLTVALHELEDPDRQTIFENCVADVNIPVGEVFTSPKLEGTRGCLHVQEVYLNELLYRDLELQFEEGRITSYGCANFEDPGKGQELIRANVLFHHETLPMGEFAIGTNTAAYRMGQKYGIAGRLPILIAEKTGPHFAVGDTCYSYEEDTPVFNPDGKEIIARDNSVSVKRKEDPAEAYFGCHTDITIPYEQLGLIEVIRRDGTGIELIRDGRFVLPGTEALNEALEDRG